MADLSAVVSRRNYGRSALMLPPGPTLTGSLAESVHVVANTVTTIRGETGLVAFNASPDHATVLTYEARLRNSGSGTVLDTEPLGKPTPDGNGVIVVDLSGFFAYRAGDFTVSIAATDAGGTTDSEVSAAFSLPLPSPTERVRLSETIAAVRA